MKEIIKKLYYKLVIKDWKRISKKNIKDKGLDKINDLSIYEFYNIYVK